MTEKMKKENPEEVVEQDIEVEISQEESSFKKFLVIIMAVFLALLVISFAFVNYPLGDIFQGRVESREIVGNILMAKNFSILFENNTANRLNKLYFKDRTKEISVCLLGYKEEREYHITSFYQPETYADSYSHVSFRPCSKDTLIMLHTHPYRHCIASQTDLETLNKTKQVNQDVLMVIMCEAERFSVYS